MGYYEMAHAPNNNLLSEPIAALVTLFDTIGCPGMIIGGVAASLLGKPRFTADVDCVVLLKDEDMPRLLSSAARIGLIPRIKDPEAFARKSQVFLLRHKKSEINIDISIGLLPFEKEAIENSNIVTIGNIQFRIPTPEDMIIFKAVAHRPRDIEDIRAILQNHPGINRRRIRRWVKDFATTLDMPEIWKNIECLLKSIPSHGKNDLIVKNKMK